MHFMRSRKIAICFLVAGCAFGGNSHAGAQSPEAGPVTGSVQFQAHVTPSGGQPEPVRQLTFYVLRKAVAQIRKEAEETFPPAELNQFIEGLDVSAELKAWMKKNKTVELSGIDFTKKLKTDDVLGIPEFLKAYQNLNGAMLRITVPSLKVDESDREKNPQRYKRARDQYDSSLRKYVEANPQSIDGLDAELSESNPSRQWSQVQVNLKRSTEQRVLVLAQTEYLAAKATSDLNGRGEIRGLGPGTYWISTLDVPAMAGEIRLQWDLPVIIRPGQATQIELSNLNALPAPNHTAR
jgi:hypothetical protein